MAQSLTTLSGFTATITVNGTEIPAKRWSITYMVEEAIEKNSMSGAYGISLFTYSNANITFEVARNFAGGQNPWAAPINLLPGTFISTASFLESQSARGNLDANGRVITATNVAIQSASETENIAGNAADTISYKARVSGPGGTLVVPTA